MSKKNQSDKKKRGLSKSMKRKLILAGVLTVILVILLAVLPNPLSGDEEMVKNGESGGNLSIVVTGDVMFGRRTPAALDVNQNPYRYVDNVTGNADILLVNTENPFTTSANAVKPDVPLKADPKYINLINGTSRTVVSANANNHVCDYGTEGMQDSMKNLDKNGIAHIGAGNNKQEATKPYTTQINGHKITIFNYMDSKNFAEYSQEVIPKATDNTPGYSAWDDVESPEQIRNAKNNGSDFIIVYMHYGNEYRQSANNDQISISHKAIDAGADTVVGAHAHVTQGIEMYNKKPVFYNLGNFIFDQSNPATHRAYFVNFNITDSNVTATVYPVNIINYLPHFMQPDDAKTLLKQLDPQSPDVKINDNGTGTVEFKLDT